MASFGESSPRAEYRSISELNTSERASGFVWEVDSGAISPAFLTHPPIMPLASFRNTAVGLVRGDAGGNWLRLGKAPRAEYRSISELNTSERASGFVWEVDSGSISPAFLTHPPDHAIGFVWSFGCRLRSREKEIGFVRGSLVRGRDWLALKIGGHTTAIMQSGPRPFSWDRATFRGHDDSFGETVRADRRTSSIGTNCQRAAHARTPASSSGDATSASGKSVEEGWRRRGRHRCRHQVFETAIIIVATLNRE